MQKKFRLPLGAGALLGALAMSTSAVATPSQAPFTGRETMSVVGDVFACQSGDLTVQSGTITTVFHSNADNSGTYHFTATIVPSGVTLTDTSGNIYTVSGASWFGGTTTDPDPEGDTMPIVSTETDHFVIRTASGGVYAKVQVVGHISPNGNMFVFDRGTCEEPDD
ncbi:hypothetical protein GCM10011492_06210 [Flexivirga endophytica]|uniref:Uncharacterized protein n=1 Tax=Flexivirga endophytica TaxID=1849103 RepID=A0A916SWE2_9MICO|nr:hypothetical protein [Flexivirga endophytica]GGB19086.1 hypothetical protein GCM10011492_06210 [Flexivirga endophytica]GHB36563.1 hypothetical protein GCM10008112_01390 [Flexivirga endophytica]